MCPKPELNSCVTTNLCGADAPSIMSIMARKEGLIGLSGKRGGGMSDCLTAERPDSSEVGIRLAPIFAIIRTCYHAGVLPSEYLASARCSTPHTNILSCIVGCWRRVDTIGRHLSDQDTFLTARPRPGALRYRPPQPSDVIPEHCALNTPTVSARVNRSHEICKP